mmetsp:Transcript_11745/g.9437  ORF Transcript_11745/g.9437 Transcript_11745/m.9437 type:complete len:167 (-) Transcript_11745:46-546(-)
MVMVLQGDRIRSHQSVWSKKKKKTLSCRYVARGSVAILAQGVRSRDPGIACPWSLQHIQTSGAMVAPGGQKQASVAEVLDGLMDRESSSGVCGAVCLDQRGFTVGQRGELLPTQAAPLVDVAAGCAQLQPGETQAPMITLETNMRTISIAARDDLVVAIARKPAER